MSGFEPRELPDNLKINGSGLKLTGKQGCGLTIFLTDPDPRIRTPTPKIWTTITRLTTSQQWHDQATIKTT
jgi:hypothetical protein